MQFRIYLNIMLSSEQRAPVSYIVYHYFVPSGVQIMAISILSVCPLAYLKNTHVQISRNFLHVLPVAMARSSADGSAVRYVLSICG